MYQKGTPPLIADAPRYTIEFPLDTEWSSRDTEIKREPARTNCTAKHVRAFLSRADRCLSQLIPPLTSRKVAPRGCGFCPSPETQSKGFFLTTTSSCSLVWPLQCERCGRPRHICIHIFSMRRTRDKSSVPEQVFCPGSLPVLTVENSRLVT